MIKGCGTVILILFIFILALVYYINEEAKENGGTPQNIERREK